jgi:hypothetical protein
MTYHKETPLFPQVRESTTSVVHNVPRDNVTVNGTDSSGMTFDTKERLISMKIMFPKEILYKYDFQGK